MPVTPHNPATATPAAGAGTAPCEEERAVAPTVSVERPGALSSQCGDGATRVTASTSATGAACSAGSMAFDGEAVGAAGAGGTARVAAGAAIGRAAEFAGTAGCRKSSVIHQLPS